MAVDCGFHLHKNLGPGLLESVYEAIMADQLARRGLTIERQAPIPIRYDGVQLPEGFRADLLIEGKLLVELEHRAGNLHRFPERRRGALPSEVEAATLRFSLCSNEPLVFARGCG
ncbi:GxxExxY protein [Sphingopyxis indica]|uniref:GxxExxY protein n=1 Tax=Sphingopyxis indica TaxID=436663 RepID=UPI0029390F97|nr:GxxExxY protein [Sphingopyxis indica]